MDRIYDLHAARAFIRAAALLLDYASVYLKKTDDEGYDMLKKVRPLIEELLYRVETKLAIEPTPSEEHSMVSSARRIIEEVILGHG